MLLRGSREDAAHPAVPAADGNTKAEADEDNGHGSRLGDGMPLDPGAEPQHGCAQRHEQDKGEDHADGVYGGHDVGLAHRLLVDDGAVAPRRPGEDRGLGAAVCPARVHVEAAVLDVELQALPRVVAGEAGEGPQGIHGLLAGRGGVDLAAFGPSGGPRQAVAQAMAADHHVLVVDAGAVEEAVFHVGVELGLVVAVGQARGECDVGLVAVVVHHEVEGAGHAVGAEANGAPGMAAVGAQGEVELVVGAVGEGQAKGYAPVVVDKGQVVGLSLGAGRRSENCSTGEGGRLD